ncbi:MAG TPA: acyl carrier protein [Polyangia bacterium]|jgi:acyl carrier protein|nr:acyl carrier protein [Polyangia bacterium]
MSESTLDMVKRIVADVLGTSVSRITADSSPETLENWDSVRHLNIVMALEERFGVELEPEDIEGMRSVMQIVAIMSARTARS